MRAPAPPLKVGIAGLGNIGTEVARWLSAQAPGGLELTVVGGRSVASIRDRLARYGIAAEAIELDALGSRCDVLVDCLAPEASLDLLDRCVDQGCTIVVVSVGVLLLNPALVERARIAGTRLLVPSGAIAGLDILRAASLGTVRSVRIRTSKPAAGLGARPPEAAQTLFSGNAREAVERWPKNLNVAATLALAGIGAERTEVEIRLDPGLQSNVHEIEIDSDATRVSIRIANRPSARNPASSAITAQSVCSLLQGLVEPLRVGS